MDLSAAFKHFDSDGSGFLDRSEIKRVLQDSE
jgi:Ca2+-binding EF-hand superfamily protein